MAERIKFYTDEHISNAVVRGLRARGVEVLTTKEAHMRGASDIDQLQLANFQGRVIFTHDTDFLLLGAQGIEHKGIVYAHQSTPIGEIIRGLVLINQVLEADDMTNQVEYL
jgi:hypothetical protein